MVPFLSAGISKHGVGVSYSVFTAGGTWNFQNKATYALVLMLTQECYLEVNLVLLRYILGHTVSFEYFFFLSQRFIGIKMQYFTRKTHQEKSIRRENYSKPTVQKSNIFGACKTVWDIFWGIQYMFGIHFGSNNRLNMATSLERNFQR